MKPISILIIDDHKILLAGLHSLLSSYKEIDVVGLASSINEAIYIIKEKKPNVILLDIAISGENGLNFIQQIKELSHSSKIIILTMYEDYEYFKEAINKGASGFVLKKSMDSDLLYAIKKVNSGEVFAESQFISEMISNNDSKNISIEKQLWDKLSDREKEVMVDFARGFTNREIAFKYYISEKTVSTYKTRALEKLNIENKSDFIKLALKIGILKN
ncbi:response regulator transcription factor [Desulfurella sp.]|uniref:response regulator transcription factor n=1 Tax=Desulfurella sp. TaxID=1962857 RepID=UPI0025BE5DE4|nr:response regulator transcription factor [Desulfurella sp.]